MVIETIVGNLINFDIGQRNIEKVYLSSDDLVKRIQRVKTDHGRELGIRLREAKDLEDGDILAVEEKKIIVIQVLAEYVLVIRPMSMKQMGEIAHQLGNRHLPAQFEGEEMIVQYDYLVEDYLKSSSIPYNREQRRMKQAFRHVGHEHG